MTKQTTIVVIGALRVKKISVHVYYGSIVNNQPDITITYSFVPVISSAIRLGCNTPSLFYKKTIKALA